ncbi:MAG: putative lipid II flippase FtsW [Oscillospiraceae bacterium]|nr:putative lipid II flippase FtsW [Oscillospiraceae bacterium]MBQ7129670.1 putative lipid II flippase FtsW [Oscillospiraceae bacterium]
MDFPFLFLVLLLLTIGLVMLWSASFPQSEYDTGYTDSGRYFRKQALCAAIGLAAMYFFSRIPARFWYRTAWPLYGVSILLLLSVLVIGQEVNGAKRWISLAGIQFQPSEVAKFAQIVLFARLTRHFGPEAKTFRFGVLGFGAALMGILVPLALEKHLSAIMLMGMVAVVMMFVAGTRMKWLLAGAGAAVLFVIVYISLMGYAGDRVTAWLHPELDPGDTGYQILQSLYAIGSGGLFGLGWGKSRQKYLYLPFQYNDYIFAIVCEELGLAGALGIGAMFSALILRGYWIALRSGDRFSTVLAAGLVTLIAVQTILNLCVVTNLLPSTGIALPFFSYGGTALAVNLGEMGIVLGISRQRNREKIQEVSL